MCVRESFGRLAVAVAEILALALALSLSCIEFNCTLYRGDSREEKREREERVEKSGEES